MKAEAWIFVTTTIFFVLVTPAYWLIAGDWTGTSALTMAALELEDNDAMREGRVADAPSVEGREEAIQHRHDNPEDGTR